MKKLLLVIIMFLTACQSQPRYYLYLYYAKTCPACKAFMSEVIPELEEEYGSQIEIVKYDIDEESSIDNYAKTCSLLEDYYANDNSGNIPLIVLDGYFAQVGYELSDKENMIQMIHDAIAGKDISSYEKEFYYFKEGKTFH